MYGVHYAEYKQSVQLKYMESIMMINVYNKIIIHEVWLRNILFLLSFMMGKHTHHNLVNWQIYNSLFHIQGSVFQNICSILTWNIHSMFLPRFTRIMMKFCTCHSSTACTNFHSDQIFNYEIKYDGFWYNPRKDISAVSMWPSNAIVLGHHWLRWCLVAW